MRKKYFFFICALLAALILLILFIARGFIDFDLGAHAVSNVSFADGDTILSGTLILPQDIKNPPIALIIHGDGPQDRFFDGGYLPLINTLVNAGIGVFTWDKAGVAESTGNWLDQTMQDRTTEALLARLAISEIKGISIDQIGFLGFSQAGWVLPSLSSQVSPAFSVLVGGAVSWRNQGTYYNRITMEEEGISPEKITQSLALRINKNDALFGLPIQRSSETKSEFARLNFVANAYWENSTNDIATMKGPLLAVWGEDDLNVDAYANAAIFKEQLKPLTEKRQVILIPNATHSLLRSDLFNYQLVSDWPWHLEYLFLAMGQRAYAPQSINLIADWINSVAQ